MKQEVPSCIDGGVHQGRSKDGTGFPPSPPVKKAGKRSQNHVAPVGEAHIADVGKAEQNRGGPPSGKIALRCLGEEVLQQAAKQELFWPGGEKENHQ